ncbi:unnamed protein product [Durusdinium trenchii]|uniref:Uncharacterized protein n=1 Tax=Durusdinium trenchii TaxID=1381693 RepID=A0ABP0R9N0_9DINO
MPYSGGDCRKVERQLTEVRTVVASNSAFAALRKDGSVVTWGDAAKGAESQEVVTWGKMEYGGDSRSVSAALREEPLKLIVGTRNSFCALRRSGTVVTWGHDLTALDASCPVGLADVETVVPSDYAFAAVRADGTVVTWGDPEGGGDSSHVQEQLKDVQQIHASALAFAAVLGNGPSVCFFGSIFVGAL